MKNLGKFFAVTAIAAFGTACNNAPEADVETREAEEVNTKEETAETGRYSVDTQGDEIRWVGFKTYADAEHKGTIQVDEGYFSVEEGEIVGGKFVIDMASIGNEDLPEEGDYNKAKLIGHLESEDFFYIEEYPTATFTVTNVEEAPEDHERGATHMLSGNLEMRGNSRNITLPASIELDEENLSVSTPEFVIDRTEWEVQALSTSIEGLAKDKLVDDNIKLKVDLKATKA